MRNHLPIAFCLLILLPSLAPAVDVETYPLHGSDPAPVLDVVRALMGDDGKVVYDRSGDRLIVVAPADVQRAVSGALKKLATPARNVRLTLTVLDVGRQERRGAGVTGSGRVVITPRGTRGQARITPHLQHQTTDTSSHTAQILMVQSGREGVLKVGKEVPFVSWLIERGRHWGYLQQQVTMQPIGAYLRFSPRIVGDGPMVSIRVTPELTGLVDGRQRSIRYTQAATELTVRSGQSFTIGGLNESNDFYRKFLIGVDRGGNHRSLSISGTASILQP